MQCVFCSGETGVVDTRESGSEIRRRRECSRCERRFTTYEKPDLVLMVIKKDGRRELFVREKLKAGIVKACEKRPISQENIEATVDAIEAKLRTKGREIASRFIGELVMQKLRKLDEVAYIRFASVYRSFDDLKHFEEELKALKKEAS